MGTTERQSIRAAAAPDASALAHVREVTVRSGTSFFWAMRFLPEARRRAMFAVYAFCREVDDIADDGATLEIRRAGLAEWRAEIDRLYRGAPRLPTAQALLPAVRDFRLQRADFLAVIDGMEMDAVAEMRAPSMAELELYCARVAGAVGQLSVCVFGDAGETARDLARAEGQALQLTNILRDLREDAARGRLYLPRELLRRHGIESDDPNTVLAHPALGRVCDDLAQVARQSYDAAEAHLAQLDRRKMRPAIVMMAVYRRTLASLVARGWRDLDRAPGPSKFVKLWLALRHGIF